MGSNLNFNSYGNEGIPSSLVRQQSIYSLTFDELQNTMGGSLGKDFGSMNMDELLKNIWTAEESQNMGVSGAVGASGGGGVQLGIGTGGGLQRQGSLTLPRTLSQKTVEDVWKDIVGGGKDGGGSAAPQRQQTLGEMTLEEFLAKAGVVREDNINGNVNQLTGKSGITGGGFYGDLAQLQSNSSAINTGIGFGFQQAAGSGIGFMGNSTSESSHQGSTQSVNLPLNVNGIRYSQQPLSSSQSQKPQQQEHKNLQQLVPRQPNMVYGAPMPLATGVQLSSPRIRGGIVGMADPGLNGNLVQGSGMGMVRLGAGAVAVATGSPASQMSSDRVCKSNGDTSSVSPVPYMFNGGVRGRRSNGSVEKVVERRQRRMIKNRESAARSRARKQAYTVELEEEVAKLKAENEELQKKQAEIMEMQKNEMQETTSPQRGVKKLCLRRTRTGPW